MPACVMAGLVIVGDNYGFVYTGAADSIAFARPKSSTLTMPSGRTLMLAGLEITVHDAVFMRRFERFADLLGDEESLAERKRAADEALSEVFTLDELGEDIGQDL
jgi:hypothetical protein